MNSTWAMLLAIAVLSGVCLAQYPGSHSQYAFFRSAVRYPPVRDGLIAWYRFEDNLDSSWGDLRTLTNTATSAGSITEYDTGRFGRAWSSSTTNEPVHVASVPITGYPFSICAWMLMPDWSDNSLNYFAINKDRSASATAYANANATSTRMRAIQLAPTSRLYMQTGGGLKTNEWVHLCAVFVSQTQAFAYVDGQLGVVQAGGDTGTNLVNMAGALVEVVVGGSVANEGAASRMNGGRLDDLMVYSIALTSNQVFDLYNWAH